MSDTRAAIRELRTLSEKRSLSALTELEAARWMALRRQLGLPPEPPNVELAPPFAAEAEAGPEPATSATPVESAEAVPIPTLPQEELPRARGPELPSAAPVGTKGPESWTGPSIDHPPSATTSSWGGPALDAPAWSDAAADRPTDPGLEAPPPAPFDEAPAARPQPEVPSMELGGAPDEPLQLAAAAEFISYARDGNEGIELPPDPGHIAFEAQGLADLTEAAPSADALSGLLSAPDVPWVVPSGEAPSAVQAAEAPGFETTEPASEGTVEALAENEGAIPLTPAPMPALEVRMPGTLAEDDSAVRLTPEPLPLETLAPQMLADEGAVALTPAPMPFPPMEPTGMEGAMPLAPAPLPLEALAPAMLATEGALPLTPIPFEALPPEARAPVGFTPQAELPVEDVPVEAAAPREEPDGSPAAGRHSPPSTWAPGSAAPPVLGAEQFANSGEMLGEGGLDPWPEPLSADASVEEPVETVGDEDLVEEVVTPLPPFPVTSPPGSGGIRGFQFPRPPTGGVPVPVPPSPPARRQTEAAPSLTSSGAVRVPVAASVAPTTPVPQPRPVPSPSPFLVAPRPKPVSPGPNPAVSFNTPVPSPRAPVPAAVTAPVAPPPAVPVRTPAPSAPQPASPPRRPTPPPTVRLSPPALQPVATEDEGAMPLLELVDEVEQGRPAARPEAPPEASPAPGTQGVFGPPMMLNPSFVEGEHRVVIHTLEGQVHRGTVKDLDLQDDVLPLQQQDGRAVRIPARRLKAVFFVLPPGGKTSLSRGERVQVTFRDGRQVVGYSEDHASGEPGFFVVPSDARTNTARVYVYRGGVQSITAG